MFNNNLYNSYVFTFTSYQKFFYITTNISENFLSNGAGLPSASRQQTQQSKPKPYKSALDKLIVPFTAFFKSRNFAYPSLI